MGGNRAGAGLRLGLPRRLTESLPNPHITLLATEQADHTPADPPAYTVDSLAATLKVTPKMIRNAIARGELAVDHVPPQPG